MQLVRYFIQPIRKCYRIIHLYLTNSTLKGTLHEFPFSSLPNLECVDLSTNELFGTVPIEIIPLSKLKDFDLSFNNFLGEIPPQIGLLINLKFLYLYGNQLKGSVPLEIGQLKSLNFLSLYANCTAQGSPGSLGPQTSTLLCGSRFQSLCPKPGPGPTKAMGVGSMPLYLTRGPLGMRSWTVHLMVHSQGLAWPTHPSWEHDCSGVLYLNYPLLSWGISLPNIPLKVETSSKATTPTPN